MGFGGFIGDGIEEDGGEIGYQVSSFAPQRGHVDHQRSKHNQRQFP